MDTEARTNEQATEAQPEHFHIPNDDAVIVDEGVTVSSPETPEPDVKPAEDQPDQEPESLLDAVQKAVETPSDPDPKEAKAEDQADAEQAGESSQTELSAEPTEDELKNYSTKAQTRIRSLVDQRNQAAEYAGKVQPFVEFMEKNDIPAQDLDVILDLTARLRHGDFSGFLQGVQPFVNLAMQNTGQVLPPDLQDQVQKGYVSPQIARELASTRAQQQFSQQQAGRTQQRQQQDLVNERADNIRSAITGWEQQVRQNDPDYDLKAEVIRRTAQAYMQEKGVPQNAAQALDYVKAAYEEVNSHMKGLQPRPKATLRTPSSTASKGGTTPQAEPRSMMEAAMQGLNAAQG